MAVELEMRGKLEPLRIGGTMEGFVHELNLQSAQGKTFILVQEPDETPIGINYKEILVVRPEKPEDAFFSDTVT